MIPIQYIISPADIPEALAMGFRWIQLGQSPTDAHSVLHDCHAAGCYLTIADDVDAVREVVADGLLLTAEGIRQLAARRPEPTGIVLQRPRPITTALHIAREVLGDDSPQIIGVATDNAADVVAAAKAGADYVQVPAAKAVEVATEVREAGCNIHLVAHFDGNVTPDDIFQVLGVSINGIACHVSHVPPSALPALLHADEHDDPQNQ